MPHVTDETTPEDRREIGEQFGIPNPDKMRTEIDRIIDEHHGT